MKEITITAAVLILCILLIRRIFRGRVNSTLLYALWLLVAVRLLLPLSLKIDLGPISQLRPTELVRQAEEMTEGRLEEPIQLHLSLNANNPLFRFFVSGAAGHQTIKSMPTDGPTSVFIAGKFGVAGVDILRVIWKAGMVIAVVWMATVNFLFFCRLRRERQPFVLPEDLTQMVNKITRRKVRIYTASHLASPCLYGFPGWEAVYLTADVAADGDKLRHVMVHELVHRRHGDSFWALLRSILTAVYWFHPLVWAAAVCSKRDCELACDEGALALLGEEERIPYGETLLSIITRRGRVSDLVCTATTMTGSAKSVKERIRFIVKKPGVLYAAAAGLIVLTVAVCLLVFTRGRYSDGMIVDEREGLTLIGADMQIHLPASIGGISGCVLEGEAEDIVVYHLETQQEVGRFARMPLKEALELVDEGREVLPVGDGGRNDLLGAYLGVPLSKTEHLYTPADAGAGVLGHEESYLPDESIATEPTAEDRPVSQHVYTATEEAAGTDSNASANYITEEDSATYIIEDELKVDYLPNEEISVTVYQPYEIDRDNTDNRCYVYLKADYKDRVKEQYREEMELIDRELKAAAAHAIVLSLNRERREALFDALTENRTLYVGDNAKVGALLDALPLPSTLNRTEGFSLQTEQEPYSLKFSYEMSMDYFTEEDRDTLYFNAAMLFCAVGNVEEITVDIQNPSDAGESHLYFYRREDLARDIPSLSDVDFESEEAFREKLSTLYNDVETHLASFVHYGF